MRRAVWLFGWPAVLAGVVLGAGALLGGVPDWLAGPSHGLTLGGHAGLHRPLLAALLLVLGWGLLRRKVAAWAMTVLLAGGAALGVDHSLWGLPVLGYALGLLCCCTAFPVLPAPAHVRAALRNGLLVLLAAGLFEFAARRGWVGHLGLPASLLILLLAVLVTVLRPAPAPAPAPEDERDRVRRLVARPDADTLAPFALRSEKTYLFGADGSAALGYRVLLGVAVVGGDPVGDPAGYPEVVARFVELCRRSGWRPAVLGARGDRVALWTAHGLHPVGIGDEVVLDLSCFGLAGRAMRNVRQAVRRTHNAGVSTRIVRSGDLPAGLRAELAELSGRWLGRARERGFAMILDGLYDGRHPDALFVLAFENGAGGGDRLVGFQRYLPCGDALSLDVMRRERGRLNGLNERMIVDLAEHARAAGLGRVSLNFAAFRGLLESGERTAAQRLGYRALHLLDPLIKVESLYEFNAKFRPDYQPRAVVLDSWLALPTVLLALLGLEFALPYDLHRDRPAAVAEGARAAGDWSGAVRRHVR